MEASEELNDLLTALSKAQGELTNVTKDKVNPFFKSKYADLAACWDTCRPVLAKHGLSIVQMPDGDDGLITVLGHESGQWMSSRMAFHPTKEDPQGLGSALTYARRYALSAVIGLAPDDDDDGQAASAPQKQSAPKQAKKAATGEAQATDKQVDFLTKLLKSGGITDDERASTWAKLSAEPTKAKYSAAIEYWKGQVEERKQAPQMDAAGVIEGQPGYIDDDIPFDMSVPDQA